MAIGIAINTLVESGQFSSTGSACAALKDILVVGKVRGANCDLSTDGKLHSPVLYPLSYWADHSPYEHTGLVATTSDGAIIECKMVAVERNDFEAWVLSLRPPIADPGPQPQVADTEVPPPAQGDRVPRLPKGNPGNGKWDDPIKLKVNEWPKDLPINITVLARQVAGTNQIFLNGRDPFSLTADDLKSIRNRIGELDKRGVIQLGPPPSEVS